MLNAYLYRVRRAALKRPWKFILALFFLGIFGIMLAYPTLMSMPNSDGSVSDSFVPRNIEVVTGGMYLIILVLFNFMFYTALKNGVIGFSTADVIYHMAGPFTPRFNLIIAASGTLQICLMFTFLISTQTAIIYGAIGVSSIDLICILLGAFVSAVIGYFFGALFCAFYADDEVKKNRVMTAGIVLDVIAVGGFAASLLASGASISDLGVKGVVAQFGKSWFIKAFPGGGWVALIYDGVINNSAFLSVAGVVLTLLSVIALVFVYSRLSLDYYDEAIAYAQKAHDMAEAKRAGIDADNAAMTRRAKVGKEKLGRGEGSSAITAIHFLMNKRGSKFFFVNPLSVMYRGITGIYLAFMSQSDSNDNPYSLIFSGFMMMIILNAVLYAGGKTVTEFTKHYVYMIPDTASHKLMACLKADIPEMAFDSVLCGALMYFLCGLELPAAAAFGLMMIVFDLLCEMAALLIMRLLPALGRQLLMMVRYLGVLFVAGLASVPMIAVLFVTRSFVLGILSGAAAGAVLLLILLPVASVVVDRAEM